MVVREGVSSYTRPHITASPSRVSVQRSKEGFLSAGFFSTKSKTLWRAKEKIGGEGKEHTPIYQSLSRQKGQDHYVPLIAKESFSSKIECFGELGRLEEAKEKMASPILQSAFAKNVKLIHFVRSQGHFLRKKGDMRIISKENKFQQGKEGEIHLFMFTK